MEYIEKPIHGSLEWLQLRHKHNGKTIVGASEVSIIMGANHYKNIIDLAIEKMREPEVREQNDAMKRGTFLEQGLLDYASAELGITITTPSSMYLNGRINATLDGLAAHPEKVFEAKTSTAYVQGDACLPEWYWQAQAQMFCTGTSVVTFIVLDRQLRITMFDVERNEQDQQHMVEQVQKFCESIDAGVLPENVPLTADQVTLLHPEPAGEVELGASGLDIVQRLQAVKEAIKELESEETELRNHLANMMRDADAGTVDGHKIITYKAQSTVRFDQKSFSDEHPDLLKKYQKKSSFRVMRFVKGAI
jgi:putative phage-type endonuclease